MTGMTSLLLMAAIAAGPQAGPVKTDLRGAWALETYVLKDGTRRPLEGRLVFTEREWLVLYFVTKGNAPEQGSAEGGTYSLDGSSLLFTHRYHISGPQQGADRPEGGMRMEIHDAAVAPTEPCVVTLTGDQLAIRFLPSGNTILLRRSSRF